MQTMYGPFRWVITSLAATLLLFVVPHAALARVIRLEVVERQPFADGQDFGVVGPYEYVRGRLHYAVPPEHDRNRAVVDLHLAGEGRLREDLSVIVEGEFRELIGNDARNEKGEVEFSADFILLKPRDPSRGNRRLLYGVNNRGNLLMLPYFNDASGSNRPKAAEHAGNGWLMREGYSLLWSAWNWDVENVDGSPLRTNLPVIVNSDGSPMTALVQAELAVQNSDDVKFEKFAWGGSRCYPAAETHQRAATLTVRDAPDGTRQLIPRDAWQFARVVNDNVLADRTHVYLADGFEKGKLYELIYMAEHPRVVGLGLVAVRDAISFFRFAAKDEAENTNPLTVDGEPLTQHAYIFGISQSGRFTTQLIYQGFHVDEQDRMVIDGALPHVAGGGKGAFNYRFAQTTHHQKHLQGNDAHADHFPFQYSPEGQAQYDPHGPADRRQGDLFAVAKQLGKLPKIIISNHEGEYWTRSASLVHTTLDGTEDAALHRFVRVYMVNGVRHGVPGRGSRRFSSSSEHRLNQLDPRPVGRALLTALDQWVSAGVSPPESRVPRIDRGELVTAAEHQAQFPEIPEYQVRDLTFPAVRHPGRNLQPPRVDFGPRFWSDGIQEHFPASHFGPRYVTLVPAVDADGNPHGGIRLPALAVPLGTCQGFNPRHADIGAPGFLKAFDSSFWPFAATRQERLAKHDPRLSIEERYKSQEEYVSRIAAAAAELREQRFLLPEDETRIVARARQLAWPPRPLDRWPFWE